MSHRNNRNVIKQPTPDSIPVLSFFRVSISRQNLLIKLITIFLFVFPLIVIFNGSLRNIWEFDLGWQLRDGEYITKHHALLKENIFSSEMADFKWTSSSWGMNVIRYLMYIKFGFLGYTISNALIMVLIFLIFSLAFGLSYWELSIASVLIYFIAIPVFELGFTGQTVSFLFLAIVYFTLCKYQQGKRKILFILIPLFILWTNLHGEFFLGYAIFGLWSVLYIVSKSCHNGRVYLRRIINESKILVPFLIFTFLSTLINPHGIELYTKEILQMNGQPMQKVIVEWFPFVTFSTEWWELVAWGLIVLLNILIISYRKEFLVKLPYIGPFLVLYVMSFVMRRYAWPMYLISLPIGYQFISTLKPRIQWLSFLISGIILSAAYVYISFVLLPKEDIFTMDWNQYCTKYVRCSFKAGEVFQEYVKIHNIPPNKYMTTYDWGGWMVWNFPRIKPTVDGRMPLWRDEKGYSAFEKYYAYERNWFDIDTSQYNLVYMSRGKLLYNRLIQLTKENKWRLFYQDETSAIFERITAPI